MKNYAVTMPITHNICASVEIPEAYLPSNSMTRHEHGQAFIR